MELRSRATEISGLMDTHITQTDHIKRIMEEKHGRKAMQETSIPVLKQNLKGTKRKADEMTTAAQRTETNISERIERLEQSKQEFKTEMAGMQNQINELMKMKTALHTGQTAYNFEKDLATYIYPPGTPITHGRIFTTLMNWLQEKRDTPEGREENKKWDKLQSECGFQWSRRHRGVFHEMIKCRNNPAHPDVDYELPIPEKFSGIEKKCLEDIRKMTIRLNKDIIVKFIAFHLFTRFPN